MARLGPSVLNKVRKRRDGAVAAEFAMVTPIFFALALGGIEFGSIAMSMSSMQLAANVAAREVAVNRLSEAAASTRASTYLTPWTKSGWELAVTESHPTEPRINTVTVTLSAPASSLAAVSVYTRAFTWTAAAQANVQQEMPFDNSPGGDTGGDGDDDDDGGDDDGDDGGDDDD